MVDVFYRFGCKNAQNFFKDTEIKRGGLELSKSGLRMSLRRLDRFLRPDEVWCFLRYFRENRQNRDFRKIHQTLIFSKK